MQDNVSKCILNLNFKCITLLNNLCIWMSKVNNFFNYSLFFLLKGLNPPFFSRYLFTAWNSSKKGGEFMNNIYICRTNLYHKIECEPNILKFSKALHIEFAGKFWFTMFIFSKNILSDPQNGNCFLAIFICINLIETYHNACTSWMNYNI